MLDEVFVQRLRCPVSRSRLTEADDELMERVNRLIDERGLPTRGGQRQRERLQSGLVTEDGRFLYPIQDGIVCMLVENAIDLQEVNNAHW